MYFSEFPVFPTFCPVCDCERGEASTELLQTLHKGEVGLSGGWLTPLQVDDTKCKTVFKNAFTTQMETQVIC